MSKLQAIYKDANVVVQSRVSGVFLVLAVLVALLPLIILSDFLTGDRLNAAMEFIVLIVFLFCLRLLYRGKFFFASRIPLVTAVLIMATLVFLTPETHYLKYGGAVFYMTAPLFLCLIMSDSWKTTLLLSISGLTVLVTWFFSRVLPNLTAEASAKGWNEFVVMSILYIFVSVFAVRIAWTNTATMRALEESHKKSLLAIRHIAEVVDTSSNTLDTSRHIAKDHAVVDQTVQEVSVKLNDLKKDVNELDSATAKALESVRTTEEQVGLFHRLITEQSETVYEVTSAVNELSASLDSMEKLAGGKKVVTDGLLGTVNKALDVMRATDESFKKASRDMTNLMGVNQIVSDIAERTNLLSMNAAIEAAHAGTAGKGFAVVADEIRKLASSTAENSALISRNLKTIMDSIKTTGGFLGTAFQAMSEINRDIGAVSDAFIELSASTREMSAAGKAIQTSVLTVHEGSERVTQSSKRIEVEQKNVNEQMMNIHRVSEKIDGTFGVISSAMGKIASSVSSMNEAVGKSGASAEQLYESILDLARERS